MLRHWSGVCVARVSKALPGVKVARDEFLVGSLVVGINRDAMRCVIANLYYHCSSMT